MTTIYRYYWGNPLYGDQLEHTRSKKLALENIYVDKYECDLPEPSVAERAAWREEFKRGHDVERLEKILAEAEGLKEKLGVDCHA